MVERVLFVDLENVHRVDLAGVPGDVRVLVFCGASQKSIPADLVVKAQPLGTRLTWIKIAGQGPNALDFHIAFYLGQVLARNAAAECTVLSGDTGFDPLMRHLGSLGRVCRRVSHLREAYPEPGAAADDEPFSRLITLLRNDKARPVRSKGLASKVKSWFPRLGEDERLALVQRLFTESVIEESGSSLTYRL